MADRKDLATTLAESAQQMDNEALHQEKKRLIEKSQTGDWTEVDQTGLDTIIQEQRRRGLLEGAR